ncbi:MAG: hypothetical protein U1D06_05395, partial [Paracoccaceae bacterium]|nr:hypothetical protein [Paracoccaceae bacterium]
PIYQRFAVQWLAEDAFQVHAFEGTAAYDAPGHVSAQNPHRPLAGIPTQGGFLTLLGDGSVDLPMRAEIYTYPVDPGADVRVVVEAAVTAATCNRELLGEILSSLHGVLSVADLTVEMPACDAVGDVLVLNNLTSDLKIAATE